MKKRLLITSIVMMLVVAVALGTSTYAWFTSNASVETAAITMVATSNTEAALGISWTDGNYGTAIAPSITATSSDATFVFSPVTPASLTNGTTLSTVTFQTATAKSVGGVFKFNANGAAATHAAYTWKDDSAGTHQSFFVKNTSPSNPLNGDLTVTADIQGDGAELIRVGVFKKDGASYKLTGVLANKVTKYVGVASGTTLAANTAYYKIVLGQYVLAKAGSSTDVTNGTADYEAGVTATTAANQYFTPDVDTTAVTGNASATAIYYISNGADGYRIAKAGTASEVSGGTADYTVGSAVPSGVYLPKTTHATAVYGTITGGNEVNSLATVDCVESINLATDLAANTAIELVVIAWMDGAALGDAEGGHSASIALSFDVVAPTPAP